MKKWIFAAILLFAGFARAHAGDLVYAWNGQPESAYDVAHSTVAISSTAVTTDGAVTGYRAVYIYNLSSSSTIYYTLGSSSGTITTVGWPIFPNQLKLTTNPVAEKIEYNGIIYYRLGAGTVASIDVTKKIIRK